MQIPLPTRPVYHSADSVRQQARTLAAAPGDTSELEMSQRRSFESREGEERTQA